jgi:tetratricopeptide (TPR) repeat protein
MRAIIMALGLLLGATAASASERSDHLNACQNWTDLEKSAISCTELIRSNSFAKGDVAALFMNRGAIKARLGLFEEAKADLMYARNLNAGLEDVSFWLGFASLETREYKTAAEHFDAFLARKPDHTIASVNRAIALWSTGETESAIAALDEVTQRSPDHASAWFQKGLMQAALGRIKPAMNDFHKAMNLKDNPEYMKCTAAAVLAADDKNRGKKDAAIANECQATMFEKPQD